ncbi:MAG: ATP-binding cassette domain-containing protein, partial [Rubrivivax sp.]
HFLESLRGVAAVKRFNAESDRAGRFANLVVAATNADVAARRLQIGFATVQRTLVGLQRVGVVWLGALAVLDGALSLGMLFAVLALQELFTQRAGSAIDRIVELRMLRLQGERLADIALTAPEHTDGTRPAMATTERAPVIELRELGFRYADGEPEVLAGVNLRIEPGESIAIAGASGSGKSTLLKLLLGLYTPTRGEILIDGVSLATFGLAAWRDRVGAVLQDEPLFASSLAEHIACFDPAPDLQRVRAAAALAAVDEELEALPMGYLTPAGDLGQVLSGGQRQRVQLARALYRRPQVLLLDEATSALDVTRERLVLQSLRTLPATRITVAHRPETLAAAARVVVLHGGRIVQDVRRQKGNAGEVGDAAEPAAPTVH